MQKKNSMQLFENDFLNFDSMNFALKFHFFFFFFFCRQKFYSINLHAFAIIVTDRHKSQNTLDLFMRSMAFNWDYSIGHKIDDVKTFQATLTYRPSARKRNTNIKIKAAADEEENKIENNRKKSYYNRNDAQEE